MLSLINISIPNRQKPVVDNLQAVFADGFIYGILAPDPVILKPLLECISGQSQSYNGEICYGEGRTAAQVAYIDCRAIAAGTPREKAIINEPVPSSPRFLPAIPGSVPSIPRSVPTIPRFVSSRTSSHRNSPPPSPHTSIDFSKEIFLLHDLTAPAHNNACGYLLACLRQKTITSGKIAIITSHDYQTLRDTCDFIYLYDKKRFPIVVEKSDFAALDDFFENVFKQ